MNEPVYECEACGATLERWEQGKYVWCGRCRSIWGMGFDAGLKHAEQVKSTDSAMGIVYLVECIAPYTLKYPR